MAELITLGEAMIRLSPPDFKRLEQTSTLDVHVSGDELNVAIAGARLGLSTEYVSRLPLNPFGRMINNKAREHGVDTSNMLWSDKHRAGFYFVEFGANPRTHNVFYDRKKSAIAKIEPGMVNWDQIFKGAKIFHLSGITPGLSTSAEATTKEAMQKAKEFNVIISLDVNFCPGLWSEEEAHKCLVDLMQYTDIVVTTKKDAKTIFHIDSKKNEDVVRKLLEKFKLKAVAVTQRETLSEWKCKWTAMASHDGKIYDAPTYEIDIIDQAGCRDSFSAGFLYGYLTSDIDYAVKFGTAYSALNHSIHGDINWCTKEEAESLMKNS
jgi:2-dehydro-3-deoxygluconokinase